MGDSLSRLLPPPAALKLCRRLVLQVSWVLLLALTPDWSLGFSRSYLGQKNPVLAFRLPCCSI
jgi:hypothetical protein